MHTKKKVIGVLKELLETGKVTPVIDSTFCLRETREALWYMVEDETHGKVIIIP